jgi:hypothetical protein
MSVYDEIFESFLKAVDSQKSDSCKLLAKEEFTEKKVLICETKSESVAIDIALALRESKRYCPEIDISYKNLKLFIQKESGEEVDL